MGKVEEGNNLKHQIIDAVLKTVQVKWLLLGDTAKLSIMHQHDECC